jgi:ribonucleoside-diphosphate reductase alpha chain
LLKRNIVISVTVNPGIVFQGLADAFMMLRMPFESEEAKQLNKDIFETIYYASKNIYGAGNRRRYVRNLGRIADFKGIFQFDMGRKA